MTEDFSSANRRPTPHVCMDLTPKRFYVYIVSKWKLFLFSWKMFKKDIKKTTKVVCVPRFEITATSNEEKY